MYLCNAKILCDTVQESFPKAFSDINMVFFIESSKILNLIRVSPGTIDEKNLVLLFSTQPTTPID